jgi:predicted RNA binding protein YcfA (HicA-like mRNA interferase family)
MKSRDLRRLLKDHGCVELRQKGSHLFVQCGKCRTTIPLHEGEDLKMGTLHAIERQLAPCLGAHWLRGE